MGLHFDFYKLKVLRDQEFAKLRDTVKVVNSLAVAELTEATHVKMYMYL